MNKELKWKYPRQGQLPDKSMDCLVCISDYSRDQNRFCELWFDAQLQCWRDPITEEENEDLIVVDKWVPLEDVLAQIKD